MSWTLQADTLKTIQSILRQNNEFRSAVTCYFNDDHLQLYVQSGNQLFSLLLEQGFQRSACVFDSNFLWTSSELHCTGVLCAGPRG